MPAVDAEEFRMELNLKLESGFLIDVVAEANEYLREICWRVAEIVTAVLDA